MSSDLTECRYFLAYNVEGKITESWLVNEEGIFLNFAWEEDKIARSRMVLRLPRNRLCYREVVAKNCFSSIENDHLGDWSPEKHFWWRLTCRQPVWKPSSESSWQFSVTMASRFKIVDEEYVGELKDEKKWNHEEKDRVLEERFQKVGEWKKLPSKFRRVRLTAISSTKHCRSFYIFRNLVTEPS